MIARSSRQPNSHYRCQRLSFVCCHQGQQQQPLQQIYCHLINKGENHFHRVTAAPPPGTTRPSAGPDVVADVDVNRVFRLVRHANRVLRLRPPPALAVPHLPPDVAGKAPGRRLHVPQVLPGSPIGFFKGPTLGSFPFIFHFLTKWNRTRIAQTRVGHSIH